MCYMIEDGEEDENSVTVEGMEQYTELEEDLEEEKDEVEIGYISEKEFPKLGIYEGVGVVRI